MPHGRGVVSLNVFRTLNAVACWYDCVYLNRTGPRNVVAPGMSWHPECHGTRNVAALGKSSKDVHRTKCQALTIAGLTHSLYTTQMARIRRYTMLSSKDSYDKRLHNAKY